MARIYATPQQYADWLDPDNPGGEPPAGATRLLRAASRQIDRALLTAIYATDDEGLPTEEPEATAIMEATCAQAAWRAANGDTDGSGVVGRFKSIGVGSLKLDRADRIQTSTGGPTEIGGIAAEAYEILRDAGLTGGEPWTL